MKGDMMGCFERNRRFGCVRGVLEVCWRCVRGMLEVC